MNSNTLTALMVHSTAQTPTTSHISGRVTCRNFCQAPAPARSQSS